MKSLLGVILVGLFIFSHGEVWGADWESFFTTKFTIWLYDVESIAHPSKNIVRVWGKEKFKIHGDLGESHLTLFEFDCLERKRRRLAMRGYNADGRLDPSLSYDFPADSFELKWGYMAPGSLEEALYKKVCK